MTARRHIKEQKTNENQMKADGFAKENIGKTTISKIDKSKLKDSEFSSFEEVE